MYKPFASGDRVVVVRFSEQLDGNTGTVIRSINGKDGWYAVVLDNHQTNRTETKYFGDAGWFTVVGDAKPVGISWHHLNLSTSDADTDQPLLQTWGDIVLLENEADIEHRKRISRKYKHLMSPDEFGVAIREMIAEERERDRKRAERRKGSHLR